MLIISLGRNTGRGISISQSRWKREGKRAATRQYNEYGEAPHSAADKVNA
jgi:hypothetical protein